MYRYMDQLSEMETDNQRFSLQFSYVFHLVLKKLSHQFPIHNRGSHNSQTDFDL